MKWFNTLSHNRWLEQETDRIFDFGKNSVVPTGFGWLAIKGKSKKRWAPICGSPLVCCTFIPLLRRWVDLALTRWLITVSKP